VDKLRTLAKKHREFVLYLLFGVLTTLVSIASYQALEWVLKPRWGNHSYLFSKWVAFILALAFAFLVNKLFVFRKKSGKPRILVRELLTFSAARLASFVLVEYVLVFVTFDWLWPKAEPRFASFWQAHGRIIEAPIDAYRFLTQWCVIQVIVVILNYIFSKWVVFKKGKGNEAGVVECQRDPGLSEEPAGGPARPER
jgi:putative flippase GtrA